MTTTTLDRPATAPVAPVTHHRTARIDGIDIFYREAGPADAPVVCCCTAFRRRRTCSAT